MKTYIDYVHNIDTPPIGKLFPIPMLQKKAEKEEYHGRLLNYNELQKAILKESSNEVFEYLSEHLDLCKYHKNIVFTTDTKSYVDDVDFSNVRAIINFKRINHIRHINDHLRSVNKLLPDAGIYIGRFQSYGERKLRIYKTFGNKIGLVVYLTDFLINRIIPKIRPLDRLYTFLTGGTTHHLSAAEMLGRLAYCGFDIIETNIINGVMHFVTIKTKEPSTNPNPTYYPLVALRRIGKKGKLIKVYKFRTMNPYSEYIQDYIIKLNGYNNVGKPENDWRVTRWGRIFRKYWIDELPQFLNVLTGSMSLVGVRPLSKVRFNELPQEVQKERIKYKPGCFPPYVALNMPDAYGNIEAERIYLRDKANNPYFTDIKYLFKSIYNILTNKISSA